MRNNCKYKGSHAKQLIASSIVEKYVPLSFHGVRGETGFLVRIADRL